MKSHRQVRRSVIEQAEASQRWDVAYQRLLSWMEAPFAACDLSSTCSKEKSHESCSLCPSFHPTTTTNTDD